MTDIGPQQKRQPTRLMFWLVAAFLICLPLEGILRKWALNDIQQPLVFIRDPILILIYANYIAEMLKNQRALSLWQSIWITLTFALAVLTFLQALSGSMPPIVYMLGLRNYALYVPLMFIMSESLTRKDVSKLVDIILLMAVPVGVLVMFQFSAPVSSPLNKGLDDLVTGRFLVAAGVVRPYGPFTFTQAQSYFGLLCLTSCFYGFERRKADRRSVILLASAFIATLVMGSLSGSRTFFFSAALIVGFYSLPGFFSRQPGLAFVRFGGTILASALLILVMTIVFPRAYETMSTRQANAERAEGSVFNRAATIVTSVGPAVKNAPAMGYGLGAGSNAAIAARGIKGDWVLGEYEWPRMVNELGPTAGIIAILVRLLMTAWLLWRCLRYSIAVGDSSSMATCGLAVLLLSTGQVVGQNQALSFCWFVSGLALAMASPGLVKAGRRTRSGRNRIVPVAVGAFNQQQGALPERWSRGQRA